MHELDNFGAHPWDSQSTEPLRLEAEWVRLGGNMRAPDPVAQPSPKWVRGETMGGGQVSTANAPVGKRSRRSSGWRLDWCLRVLKDSLRLS